jgi:formylglycine-generating enzyme required for sulfatase activity
VLDFSGSQVFMNRWILPCIGFALLVLTVAVVYRILKPPPGILAIHTIPSGVQVFVDGRIAGTTVDTGLTLVIKKTAYRFLELTRQGYETDTSTIWVAPDQRLEIDVVMRPPGMAWIRGGEFVMGWNNGAYNEKPEHAVRIMPYYIDRTEVMVSDFRKHNSHYIPAFLGDDLPATQISWQEAHDYCQSVGKRLPTEAEWERACRGIQQNAYAYGMAYDADKARTGLALGEGPLAVNALGGGNGGLLGMSGNVWEWCDDWYGRDSYQQRLSGNFDGPADGEQHVLRGGAWYSNAQASRCTHRPGNVKKMRDPSFGFRCARDSE